MTIELLSDDLDEIKELATNVLEKKKVRTNKKLKEGLFLIKSSGILDHLDKFRKDDFIEKFDYERFVLLSDKFNDLSTQLHDLKEDLELKKFFASGKYMDLDELKKIFQQKKLYLEYPNFKWVEFKKIINNPFYELKNCKGETIIYDKVFIKKILYSIIHMIFDEMDTNILLVGDEGLGKSCFASQLVLLYYTIVNKIGLINYKFELKNLVYSNLTDYLEAQELQKDTDFFNIMALDEAYALNRLNFKDPASLTFKYVMRTERKRRRINILNIPQIGELEVPIVLTRTNFIINITADISKKTGLLLKGKADLYIIPRGKNIYSHHWRKMMTKTEIKKKFSKLMMDRGEYYVELTQNLIIKRMHFDGVWGYNKKEYDNYVNTQNRKNRLAKDFKITDYLAYIIHKNKPPMSFFGFPKKNGKLTKQGKREYEVLNKWFNKIDTIFESNPVLTRKFELLASARKKKDMMRLEEKNKKENIKKQKVVEVKEQKAQIKKVELIKDLVNVLDENLKPHLNKKGDKIEVTEKFSSFLEKNNYIN